MKAAATSRPDRTGPVQRDAARAGESRLQLPRLKHGAQFRRDAPARDYARSRTHTHKHIPPSRLRDSLLLAERVKRGAGRSIMELAWRDWA